MEQWKPVFVTHWQSMSTWCVQAHDTAVRTMIWSHDNLWMLTADHSGFVKYWQSNMNNVKMYQVHRDPVRGLRWDMLYTAAMAYAVHQCGTLSSSTLDIQTCLLVFHRPRVTVHWLTVWSRSYNTNSGIAVLLFVMLLMILTVINSNYQSLTVAARQFFLSLPCYVESCVQ